MRSSAGNDCTIKQYLVNKWQRRVQGATKGISLFNLSGIFEVKINS